MQCSVSEHKDPLILKGNSVMNVEYYGDKDLEQTQKGGRREIVKRGDRSLTATWFPSLAMHETYFTFLSLCLFHSVCMCVCVCVCV
jgi:hypothetical protein